MFLKVTWVNGREDACQERSILPSQGCHVPVPPGFDSRLLQISIKYFTCHTGMSVYLSVRTLSGCNSCSDGHY